MKATGAKHHCVGAKDHIGSRLLLHALKSSDCLRYAIAICSAATDTARPRTMARLFRVDPTEIGCDYVLRSASASDCDCFLRLKD